MPLTQREAIQLGVLLLCVPLQYLLCAHLGSSLGPSKSQAVLQLVSDLRALRDTWLRIQPWKRTWLHLVSWLLRVSLRPPATPSAAAAAAQTSLAVEVLQYREREGHFALSRRVRGERPDHLRFRIGQVVRHRTLGYRAVIVGWDLEAKAPEAWLKDMYGDSKVFRRWPHYALLIDSRDRHRERSRASPRHAYVVQEQLELLRNTEVQHPDMEEMFEYFDGAQYIPQAKLKAMYPRD